MTLQWLFTFLVERFAVWSAAGYRVVVESLQPPSTPGRSAALYCHTCSRGEGWPPRRQPGQQSMLSGSKPLPDGADGILGSRKADLPDEAGTMDADGAHRGPTLAHIASAPVARGRVGT